MQSEDRLHALDAVRAWALLIGVFFHAAISFITSYTNGMTWAADDRSQSMVLLVFVGASHLFRMSMFFLIAGFFAHLVYHRKGAGAFAQNRLVRIAIPFVVGLCIMRPLLNWIWHLGDLSRGKTTPLQLWPKLDDLLSGHVNLTHLWFLYYLLLFYVLMVGARYVFVDRIDPKGQLRASIDRWWSRAVEGTWAPLLIGAPIAIVAAFDWSWAGGGMPTPDGSFWPQPIALGGYGGAFAAGWLLHRNVGVLTGLKTRVHKHWYFAIGAAVLASGAGALVGLRPDFIPYITRPLSALLSMSFTWYVNFALLGLALNKLSEPSPRTRYIADASYWIYISHLPVVCALQVWVANWNWHWTVKYAFIMSVAFGVLFISYEWLVRYTFIGAVLNGRKVRPETLGSAVVSRN